MVCISYRGTWALHNALAGISSTLPSSDGWIIFFSIIIIIFLRYTSGQIRSFWVYIYNIGTLIHIIVLFANR